MENFSQGDTVVSKYNLKKIGKIHRPYKAESTNMFGVVRLINCCEIIWDGNNKITSNYSSNLILKSDLDKTLGKA